MNENRKRLGSLSLLLLILYGCVVIYFVLFSDRLGRGDGYSTYRYNLVPFEEIRRFIIYMELCFCRSIFTKLIWQSACIFPNRFFSSDMEIGENRMYPDYYICFFIQPLHRDITAYHKGWCV